MSADDIKTAVPFEIGGIVYRPEVAFDGVTVYYRNQWGEPPPGDPDGPSEKWSTKIAKGHQSQDLGNWEYTTTAAPEGAGLPSPPKGDGWHLNTHAGDEGHGQSRDGGGRPTVITYWRRRKP